MNRYRMANEEKESFLNDDPEISSQRWCLLSFISPENVLSRKDTFLFTSFVKQHEFQMKTKLLEKFLVKTVQDFNAKLDVEANRLEALDLSGASAECRKSQVPIDSFLTNLQDFVKSNQKELTVNTMKEEYDDYLFKNSAKLEDEFYAKNDFKTTVRGLKIRGAYGAKEEAESRAKKLQKADPDHNIYVGQVGKWLPWDPNPSSIADHEYAEDQLNTLMKKYKENEEQREQFTKEQRDQARKKNAVEVSRPREEPADVPSLGSASEFQTLFNGVPDLAIQRKMEKNL